jgi:hypothetical protein
MLVPGEYLTCPTQQEQMCAPASAQVDVERSLEPRPAAPAKVSDEAKPRSFLLMLLNALGAVHT